MQRLQDLRKWQLKALQTRLNQELSRRYAKKRPVKYGALNKGFTDDELVLFLAHVRNEKALLIFQLMAGLGLRVNEACKLLQDDRDLASRRLWVRSQKGSAPTMFYLYPAVYQPLLNYQPPKGLYLFAKQHTSNQQEHLSPNWVRKEFRLAVQAAGLDFTYAESEETYHGRQTRKLHRLTTHSLRHYFITRIRRQTGDLLLTQKLARHRDIRNTIRYTYTTQTEIDQALIECFPSAP